MFPIENAEAGLGFEVTPDGVGVLTLNRPDQRNALNWALYQAVEHALYGIAARPDVRVVILRGAGRSFCAGGDISMMDQIASGELAYDVIAESGVRLMTNLLNVPQPTIAVVGGAAMGIGASLAVACDFVLASDKAKIADPHVQMGLVPGDGGLVLWAARIGMSKAREYLMTGDVAGAEEALALGLINRLYPAAELDAQAMAFAGRLANGPQKTIRAIKGLANQSVRSEIDRSIRGSLSLEAESYGKPYHLAAVKGFLDNEPLKF